MTILGHIENGQLVLDEVTPLPEGAAVVCHILSPEARGLHPDVLRLTGIVATDSSFQDGSLEALEEKRLRANSD